MQPAVLPPEYHHLAYWELKWRGKKKTPSGLVPIDSSDPWFGLRAKIFAAFRDVSARQAQDMGLMDPHRPFAFKEPDRNQYAGFDGVVFPMTEKRPSSSCAVHATGGSRRKVFGTKFTLASTRINGQYGSRVILDFRHNGKDVDSDARAEADSVVRMALELRDRTRGGLKGIISDGVLRDKHITPLQRGWVSVVSPPHASSNPGPSRGTRMGPGRRERDHLRRVVAHRDANDVRCEHVLHFAGGRILELILDLKGAPTPVALEVIGYEQRGRRDFFHADGPQLGPRREYLIVRIRCPVVGDFTHRVPLFHTEPGSDDPDYKWGEVARVFGLGTAAYQHLYGARNDTESRHADLKARLKHLPPDVPGQSLRLLGAALVVNSVAWHVHLDANGRGSVLKNTC